VYCFLAHKPEEKRPEVYSDAPPCDDNKFDFGIMGGPTLFGGVMPSPIPVQSSHSNEPPFALCQGPDSAVKSESLEGQRQKITESDSPAVVLDAIRDLDIL
jgi:hypothetical protein